ncbi:neocarzinostatin apoprotein domain-containing protein [Aquihabitans daechungensis]|uniref:neocarzinostatin apoprotein domain-containing protein n=1 Tax=Aquihabitans daechungensis TaxID=1052257 RepID=UPI003B9E3B71
MTDLEPRLHRLRQTPVPAGPDPAEVRTRAARRKAKRHRRLALGAVPVVALLLVAAAAALTGDDGRESVVTGTDPTTTAADPTTTRPLTRMGNVDGVALSVTPTTNLRDGQIVTVEIEGLEAFTSPVIILCAGDVTEETAARDCDLTPLEVSGATPDDHEVAPTQQVAVRRVIRLLPEVTAEDDLGDDFDCATEPVGCVLVVGNNSLPATGVGVAVTFSDEPLKNPTVAVDPARELQDRQEVRVEATGLRPNSTFLVNQCSQDDPAACNEITWPSAKTDDQGTLRTTVAVHAAIYGWKGRVDCTAEPCMIAIRTEGLEHQDDVAIAFASDAVAPVPQLEISPSGPYEDRQEVTVTGTGFPPGFDVSGAIAQCPADQPSEILNQCGYSALRDGAVIVDDEGRFTTTVRLNAAPCRTEAGCLLGWVLNHGPTIAKAPVTFR